jgi:hypothetical protein
VPFEQRVEFVGCRLQRRQADVRIEVRRDSDRRMAQRLGYDFEVDASFNNESGIQARVVPGDFAFSFVQPSANDNLGQSVAKAIGCM